MLTDGLTDRAVKEQKLFYVMFVDSDTHKPTLAFFKVIEIDDFGQTALGMMAAIKHWLVGVSIEVCSARFY